MRRIGRLYFSMILLVVAGGAARAALEAFGLVPTAPDTVLAACAHGRTRCPHGCDSCYCSNGCAGQCARGPHCHGCWREPLAAH